MTKRNIGTSLMAAGFVYVLITLMLTPEAKEASMLGFALIGFGCVLGTNDKQKTKTRAKVKEPKKKK